MAKSSQEEMEITKLTEDEFKENLEKFHGRAYTEDELREEFIIESVAYGGILCTKKDTEDLILFNKAISPVSDKAYFVKMGGF